MPERSLPCAESRHGLRERFATWRHLRKLPKPRKDARTYVAHGDNHWGNSITFRGRDDGTLGVSGWLSRAPFPQDGDRLLVRMASGKWGVYVLAEREYVSGVSDMFNADAFGPVGYAEEVPQTKHCDEFIPRDQVSAFAR